MTANFLLYTICLVANLQILPTARPKLWLNRVQTQKPNSYESLEIIPYISAKLADRTNIMTERIDEKDKDNLLTLFTNTKKEVDAKMLLLNKLHGYFNATYNGIFEVYSYYNKLKLSFGFLSHLGFSKRRGLRRNRRRFL